MRSLSANQVRPIPARLEARLTFSAKTKTAPGASAGARVGRHRNLPLAVHLVGGLPLGYNEISIRQRRAADLREVIEPDDQPLRNAVKICDVFKSAPLAALRALAVAGMQKRQQMRLLRDGSTDTGIHSAAEKHNRFVFRWHTKLNRAQTPRIAGSQMNLCSCRPKRTGTFPARIHSASSRGSSKQCDVSLAPLASLLNAGENNTAATRSASR